MRLALLISSFIFVISWSCRKNNDQGNIPFVSVNISFDIDNPAYRDVKIPGGHILLSGGSRGIIVYRKDDEQFMAYDRHSPINPNIGCTLIVDEDQIFVVDTCFNGTWLITDGSPQSGEADRSLLEYSTTFNGRTVRIFN